MKTLTKNTRRQETYCNHNILSSVDGMDRDSWFQLKEQNNVGQVSVGNTNEPVEIMRQ